MLPSNRRYALSNIPDSCVRRKTGTATNSCLWNWLAVPGLPTADTPPVARPIFVPPDEVLPHNATDTTKSRGPSGFHAFLPIAQRGVPFITMGARTLTCHTSGGVRMIDWFASQDLSPSPQPQAEKGLTHARVTHSTSGFCVTTPPVADGPAAYQIPGVTPTSLTGNCNFPAYRS